MRKHSFRHAQLMLLLVLSACVATATGKRNDAEGRVFNEDYLEGLYGRIFEYSAIGNARPCPSIIDHIHRGAKSTAGNAWAVPHDKILEDGRVCNDGRSLLLSSFHKSSDMPAPVEELRIARESFELMRQDSTGFWMGADVRVCGRWAFPHPTFVFFVKEFDRSILTSFRVRLGPGKKYMFVVSEQFTCIYEDVPRKNGASNVEVTGTNGSESSSSGSTGGAGITTVTGSGASSGTGSGSNSASGPAGTSDEASGSAGGSAGGSAVVTPMPTDSPKGSISASTDESATSDPATGTVSASDGADREPGAVGSGSASGSDHGSNGGTTGSDGSSTDNSEDGTASPGDSTTTDGSETEGDGPTIVDIANGAAPPSATPSTESDTSIADIAPGNDVSVGVEPTREPNSPGNTDSDKDEESNATVPLESNSGESLCFPANATVVTRTGRRVRMDRLRIGEEVLARAGGEYSAVFMFSHAERTRMAEFVRLSATGGLSVELTAGHLLYVGGGNAKKLTAARDVCVGDTLSDGEGWPHRVVKTDMVWRRGVFNPHTVAGDLIVNGIATSAYTTAFGARCGHTLLAPARGLWRVVESRSVERVVLSEWGRALSERWIRPLLSELEKTFA